MGICSKPAFGAGRVDEDNKVEVFRQASQPPCLSQIHPLTKKGRWLTAWLQSRHPLAAHGGLVDKPPPFTSHQVRRCRFVACCGRLITSCSSHASGFNIWLLLSYVTLSASFVPWLLGSLHSVWCPAYHNLCLPWKCCQNWKSLQVFLHGRWAADWRQWRVLSWHQVHRFSHVPCLSRHHWNSIQFDVQWTSHTWILYGCFNWFYIEGCYLQRPASYGNSLSIQQGLPPTGLCVKCGWTA